MVLTPDERAALDAALADHREAKARLAILNARRAELDATWKSLVGQAADLSEELVKSRKSAPYETPAARRARALAEGRDVSEERTPETISKELQEVQATISEFQLLRGAHAQKCNEADTEFLTRWRPAIVFAATAPHRRRVAGAIASVRGELETLMALQRHVAPTFDALFRGLKQSQNPTNVIIDTHHFPGASPALVNVDKPAAEAWIDSLITPTQNEPAAVAAE